MINGLEGIPGSGKSYEAVAFHVLDALRKGRLVVTNLPLLVDVFAAISPDYRALLEVRVRPMPIRGTWDANRVVVDEEGNTTGEAFVLFEDGHVEAPASGVRTFGHVWDYYHTWKGKKGEGPLFIIDECHVPLPKIRTDPQVVEWFKLHRHFNVDVLLMTQSFRDMMADISVLIAMLIKCRKADILGRSGSYIRKVHGGYRGAVISTEERKYEPQFFKLYKSHTQGNSVAEAGATDVAPFIIKFRRFTWAVLALLVLVAVAVGWYLSSHSFVRGPVTPAGRSYTGQAERPPAGKQATMGQAWAAAKPVEAASAAVVSASGVKVAKPVVAGPDGWPDPFQGKGVHLVGRIGGTRKDGVVLAEYILAISENASFQGSINTTQLQAAGFVYHSLGDCVGMLEWHGHVRAVVCDSPQMSPSVGAAGNSATQPNANLPEPGTGNVTPHQAAPAGAAAAPAAEAVSGQRARPPAARS